MLETEKERNRGITLIALVVTIAVLIILAGITLGAITGNDSIINKAKGAKSDAEYIQWEEKINTAIIDAENKNKDATMDDIINELINKKVISEASQVNEETGAITTNEPVYTIEGKLDDYLGSDDVETGLYENNSTINGEETGTAMNPIIPAGFKPVETDTSSWGDGKTAPTEENVNKGLVIEDGEENQFVWIPVKSAEQYIRNDDYDDLDAYTDVGYLPEGIQPKNDDSTSNENAERDAVVSKGGFYISRFEAGKETNGNTNILVSKKGATVWNNISQSDSKEAAKTFINNDNVKSALCSGIQWDMTMMFVDNKEDGSNDEDKTFDVTKAKSSRHTGSTATAGENEADRVCNIYDLEGNFYEYIPAKTLNSTQYQFIFRGGNYKNILSACDDNIGNGSAGIEISFRFVLYVI